jgi:5-formyltetrahydrofolate cyclo-ligase
MAGFRSRGVSWGSPGRSQRGITLSDGAAVLPVPLRRILSMGDATYDHKRELRRRLITVRRTLAREVVQRLSAIACDRLLQRLDGTGRQTFIAYVGMDGETDPASAVAAAVSCGSPVAFPRVLPNRLEFAEAVPAALVPGWRGIPEPGPEARPCPTDVAAAILVPGVAFDTRGYRLGRGGAYYDRALKSYPRATRIGFAYEFQVLDVVPTDPWDVPMDFIVTEARMIAARDNDKEYRA